MIATQQQIELMGIGCIAVFAVYNLVLLFQIKQNYYLYLALMSFFVLVRATLVDDGSMIFYSFFPDASLDIGRKIEYFSSYVSSPISLLFCYSLYPYTKVEKYVKWVIIIAVCLLVVVLVTPYNVFYYTLSINGLFVLAIYALIAVILARAIKEKKVGAMNVLTGALLCFLFVIGELLTISNVVYIDIGANLVSLGFVVFLFFQSVALSEIFAQSFEENQELNKNLESRVAIKTAELERSNQLRDTLVRIISHDLRGPLGNLKSVISLTLEDQINRDQTKEFMGTIDKGVDHTLRMLDELMEWGHASSANEVKQEEIELEELLKLKAENLKDALDKKNLVLEIKGDVHAKCLFDRNALKVVLRNLLSNAVKFTEKGGKVRVEVLNRTDDLLISVVDSGMGIPSEMKKTLFEMKKDNKRPGTENEKSSGVGLFICKDLVTQNGGLLEVDDNPDGKGSVFRFTLRKA